MLGNSSSCLSDSLIQICSNSKPRHYLFIGLLVMKFILILPLSTFILHMGYQRWQQQSSFDTVSHSDVFSFHQAAIELFWAFGLVFYICSFYTGSIAMTRWAFGFMCFTFYGEGFFHLLTCVERYLAVMHPITYRGLKTSRGVRIRNICIGLAWFLSFGLQSVHADETTNSLIISICFISILSIIVMCFCSFSVLHALIRPGPGDGGGEKDWIHQSKQKAFYTITTILSTVWIWLFSLIIASSLRMSPVLSESAICVLIAGAGWFNLPSCLVSPLLFLHRTGKLSCSCFKCVERPMS